MADKLVKLNDQWLLLAKAKRRGMISISHIDEIWTNITDENVTELFLTGERGPIHVELPLDDVLAIVTGPPHAGKMVTMNYGPGKLVTAENTLRKEVRNER